MRNFYAVLLTMSTTTIIFFMIIEHFDRVRMGKKKTRNLDDKTRIKFVVGFFNSTVIPTADSRVALIRRNGATIVLCRLNPIVNRGYKIIMYRTYNPAINRRSRLYVIII